jgi:catechol-2,3-dioxygenase
MLGPNMKRTILRLLTTCILSPLILMNSFSQSRSAESLRSLLWQDGMKRSEVGEINVFRRFPAERRPRMAEFYNDVLGLTPLSAAALGGNSMIRYPLGNSEVKLFPVAQADDGRSAPVQKATGIRLLTFFYSDEASLTARFKELGYPAPQFQRRDSTGARAALVQDPDGQWSELVVTPGASRERLDRFEIGITVSDLEKSRAFYRDFIGLQESDFRDELLAASGYSYRHGDMTINIWTFGSSLQKDTNTAGIQYITWDVEQVDKTAKALGAKIDRPLSGPGFPRTIWFLDPDGVSNYFAQFAENSSPR